MGFLLFLQQVNSCLYSVHIHSMRHGVLRVSPLRRGPFVKQTQKYPKRPCPGVRPSLRSGVPRAGTLRGHAVTGHPWPNTALPASMPGDPLRRTSTRPPEGAGRSRAMPAEAADRPACLAARSARLAHLICGSGLARDGIGAIQLKYRAACIASKPAPTRGCAVSSLNLCFCCSHGINQATRTPLTGG